jgi:hypothetical protein
LAGEELLTFFAFPRAQWKTRRTTNVIERLHEEFRRRVKTQGSLPTEDAALVLLFGSSSVARSGCAGWMGGAKSLQCYASTTGQRHDASRAAVRIALDPGACTWWVWPESASFVQSRRELC